MKTLLIALFASFFAMADDCSTELAEATVQETKEITTDVPKFLLGATVCVKLASGQETCSPAEKFKVVPRKQQFVVTKTKQLEVTSCTQRVKADPKRNRVSFLAGNGTQEGLSRTTSGNTVTVESNTGAVAGYQYQRLLPYFEDRLSVGVQGQTNKSLLLNVGLEF
jgi:hypothetical protein